MKNNTTEVMATPAAAALLGAGSAWGIVSGPRVNHALAVNPVPSAVRPEAPCALFGQVPALAMPASTRKQTTNVLKTRAGGFGAMGPHPEREPGPA